MIPETLPEVVDKSPWSGASDHRVAAWGVLVRSCARTAIVASAIGWATVGSLGLEAETLIPTGALWRWRPGTNEASAPITAWRSPDFQDSQFASTPAPFW